jgi:YidC/Oxa1 family membrane protein insertase
MDKRSFLFVLFLTVSLFLVHLWFTREEKPATTRLQQTEQVGRTISQELPHPDLPTSITSKEQFYVLENEYQQLVFSSFGGALAEINLPFYSEKHPNSVVREIGFDRTLKKDYPNNDYFPSSAYFIANPSGSRTPLQVPQGELGGYYPLLRRSIFADGQHAYRRVAVHYYSLNVAEQQGENFPVVMYQLKRLEKDLIELESIESNRKITKTFSFPKNYTEAPYCFDLSIKVEGDARGLSLTSGVPEVELISGSSSPSLKYRLTRNGKAQVEQIDLPKTATAFTSIYPDWVCNSNGFLGLILDPLTEIGSGFTAFRVSGEIDPTRLTVIDAQYRLYPAQDYPGYQIHLPLRASNEPIQLRVFAGPFESDVLKQVDRTYSDPATGYNPDYIASQSFHGWFAFISEPFAKFLFFLMKLFYQLTHSWGISIIFLTIALRIMLYPLNGWSIKSTMRMQQVAPQVAQIQERYKKDPKRAQIEIMTLYREKGVNPLTGCFPILIQIPFLIGMFDLLKSTFELRGARFIPGWIDNLTAPDVLFTWNYPIFFFGNSFHLLPFVLGLVMYLQQRFSSPLPKDRKLLTDQQRQQKLMGNIMVIVFTVMFYKFPSGLNIYWLSSMLLGILQQWWMTRKVPKKGTVVVLNKPKID